MNAINFSQLYRKFTKDFNSKVKDIFSRRFGIKGGEAETLESIGKSLGITRERVRQIEEAAFASIRKNNQELGAIFADFSDYFKKYGGFRKEENIFEDFGGKSQKPYVLFLLTLGEEFSKVAEKKEYHYFWANIPNAQEAVKGILEKLVSQLKKIGKPINEKDFLDHIVANCQMPQSVLFSALEISKKIQKTNDGLYGLSDWPEIKPRGVKDKAFLIFKKHGKPLHFTHVAKMIDQSEYNMPNKKTYAQTVHNELIKDPRFVLVGRGIYALADWGYTPGTIKEVIEKILKEKNGLANKDEIVNEVLSRRLVSKNTVLMNLNNKKYFNKDENNNYFLKGTQLS